MPSLNLQLIEQATSFLKDKVLKTPMEFSPILSEHLKVPVYLKLESLQHTGSFKFRGALFYVSTLSEEEKSKGVAACSAGNHGLGVATAAKMLGIKCTIFVPQSIEKIKYQKILALGANINLSSFPGYDDTLQWALEESKKEELHFISAFEDERIMAGNGGSLATEILEKLPEVEHIFVPIGGGGLSSGLAYFFKAKKPSVTLFGCQHQESPAFQLSLEKGLAVTQLPAVDTVAGGIEGGIGSRCFEILKTRIDHVCLASEEEIIQGFRWMLEHHQYLIEPTSAVTLASCLFKNCQLKGPTVVILTGRNVSYSTLKRLIE